MIDAQLWRYEFRGLEIRLMAIGSEIPAAVSRRVGPGTFRRSRSVGRGEGSQVVLSDFRVLVVCRKLCRNEGGYFFALSSIRRSFGHSLSLFDRIGQRALFALVRHL